MLLVLLAKAALMEETPLDLHQAAEVNNFSILNHPVQFKGL